MYYSYKFLVLQVATVPISEEDKKAAYRTVLYVL